MLKEISKWWKRKRKRKEGLWPERQVVVECNEVFIKATYPSGEVEEARWDSLESVEVFTNNSGPWGADVWFVITSKSGQCKYPQGATGEEKALDYLLAIEGFDEEEFIRSMGCTGNAQFICWEK